MKKVSVIIPCYNVTQYIDHCVQSLIDQTIGFENLEVILINDYSTDSTLGKLMALEAKYPNNIIVIPLERNVKQGAARNIGIQYASGEYVDYLDADDYMVPGALAKLYRIARQNDADIVEYLQQDVYDHDTYPENTKSGQQDKFINIRTIDDKRRFILSGEVLRSCADKFYRRDFIIKNDLHYAEGVYDEESLFTVMAAICCTKYYKLQEYLYCYYQNPAGTCYNHTRDVQRRDDNAKVWFKLLNELIERHLIDDIYEEFELAFIENYLVRSVKYSYDRHLPLDLSTIQNLQATVNAFFPNFRNNRYVHSDPAFSRLVPLVGMTVTEDNKDDFIRAMAAAE